MLNGPSQLPPVKLLSGPRFTCATQFPETQMSPSTLSGGKLMVPVAEATRPAPTFAWGGPICSHSGATVIVPVSDAVTAVVTQSDAGVVPSSSTHCDVIVVPRMSSSFEAG